jgi:virulence-associated protein VagC
MAEEAQRRAKLFKNGRSQAVRLPHDLRFGGKEVLVRRFGNGVLLEPLPEVAGEGALSLAPEAVKDSNPKNAAFLEAVERAIREMEKS